MVEFIRLSRGMIKMGEWGGDAARILNSPSRSNPKSLSDSIPIHPPPGAGSWQGKHNISVLPAWYRRA